MTTPAVPSHTTPEGNFEVLIIANIQVILFGVNILFLHISFMFITLNLEPGNTCTYLAKMCTVSSDLVCYNGASCWCDKDVAKCFCFYGYSGENCEIPPGIQRISFLQRL